MNRRTLPLTALAAALLGVLVPAQPACLVPPLDDGFAAGCCNTPTPLLPSFPAATLQADWGVYNGCNLGYTATGTVTLGAPTFFLCDYAFLTITIQLPNLMPVGGVLLAKYARTWTEGGTAGAVPTQIYRFLINGDLPIVPSTNCPAPSCVPPCGGLPWFKPAHMLGHIDYACSPAGTGFDVAVSLHHLPGCLQHAFFSSCPIPALSNSPYSYHLVGPSPFLFWSPTEPQGALLGDAVRPSTLFLNPLFYLCHGEAEVQAGGSLTTVNGDCLCGPFANGPWRHQNLSGTVCCLGWIAPFQSVPVPGTPLAQTGLACFNVGQYLSTANYPGTRTLHVYIGVLSFPFTCSPVLNPLSVVSGVGTHGPAPGQSFPGATPASCTPASGPAQSFIDLHSMIPLVNAPNTFPGLGSLFASDMVLSFNAQ